MHPLNPIRASVKVTSALMEAIHGAVFFDSGLDAVKQVMKNLGLTYDFGMSNPLTFITTPQPPNFRATI